MSRLIILIVQSRSTIIDVRRHIEDFSSCYSTHSHMTCNTESGFADLIGSTLIGSILFKKMQRNVNIDLNDKKHSLIVSKHKPGMNRRM